MFLRLSIKRYIYLTTLLSVGLLIYMIVDDYPLWKHGLAAGGIIIWLLYLLFFNFILALFYWGVVVIFWLVKRKG